MKKNKLFLFLLLVALASACIVPAQLPLLTATVTGPAALDTVSFTLTPPAMLVRPSETPLPTLPPPMASPTATLMVHPALASSEPYLVYQREAGNVPEIVFLDADGLGQKIIPYPPDASSESSYIPVEKKISPDGKWLAYYSGSAGQCMGNGLANGSDLALHLLDLASGETRLITKLLSADYPANFEKAARELGLRDVTAATLQNAFVCGINQSLAWSPDGSTLAFAGQMDGLSSDLYVYEVTKGALRRMSSGPQEVQSISWSADGKWIIDGSSYSYGEGMKSTIYYTKADGSSIQQFSENTPPIKGSSRWLNDHLYFEDKYLEMVGRYDLQVLDINSGKIVDVWKGMYDSLAFLPGGNWMAFYARTAVWPEPNPANFTPALYVIDLTSFHQTRIERPVNPDIDIFQIEPISSAGGMKFLVRPAGIDQDIYVLSTDGTLEATGIRSAWDFFVSPDRTQWLAINTQLRLFLADGMPSQAIDLPPNLKGRNISPVVWRPDNTGLFFAYGAQVGEDLSLSGLYSVDFSKGNVVMVDGFPTALISLPDSIWVDVPK